MLRSFTNKKEYVSEKSKAVLGGTFVNCWNNNGVFYLLEN